RQLVMRALTQRGVEQSRWQSIQYSPDRQVVRVERARVVRKNGTILETRSDGERNVSEPWYAMYYDLRSRVVGFPQLEPGDLLGYVHVSTYKDWESVARFYWWLVKDQLRVTDEVRAAADEAVSGVAAEDEPGRIRAVYDYVVSRTRYVALEFGIHSFKPYPVE